MIRDLLTEENIIGNKSKSLYYYGGLLYSYSKNIFYYKYAYDNIKAGKEKFNLPFRATLKEVYSNMFIIRMFDETALATLLQDINPHDIKIYLKNSKIIQHFGAMVSERVSAHVRASQEDCIKKVYAPIENLVSKNTKFLETVSRHLNGEDYHRIKNRLYTLDFWMSQDVFGALSKVKKEILAQYGDMSVLGMCALIKDTVFGLYLYTAYIQKQTNSDPDVDKIDLVALYRLYCTDILHLSEEFVADVSLLLKKVYKTYSEVLADRVQVDDNEEFLKLAYENRQIFTKNKQVEDILHDISGEDIVWFKGFLKNISYYNKRYIIPN